MFDQVKVRKAQHDGILESLIVVVDNPIEDRASIEESTRIFHDDAVLLEEALHSHLPGGTYDQLAGLMLQRLSSRFIVAHK